MEAVKSFNSLNLENWFYDKKLLGHGGQAFVLQVKNVNGVKGAFRYLRKNDATSVNRFHRELSILTNPEFQHKNIVNILDYSKDKNKHWYISKFGNSFYDFWLGKRRNYCNHPKKLLNNAISIIEQLLNGLIPLHENGVVHRDIKCSNLIIDIENGTPILIDFGLAFCSNDERVTSEQAAVGNMCFSPSEMMYRMNDIPPWLDIFQLAQLFMWLIYKKPIKQWHRPIDWRHVNYNDAFDQNSLLAIRAFTSKCSEQLISPKDSKETLIYLKSLFFNDREERELKLKMKNAHVGKSKGQAMRGLELANIFRLMKASFGEASIFFLKLKNRLDQLYTLFVSSGLQVSKAEVTEFADYLASISDPLKPSSKLIYGMYFGEKCRFLFNVSCAINLPRNLKEKDSNVFRFDLVLNSETYINNEFPAQSNYITVENGVYKLNEHGSNNGKIITIDDLISLIHGWIDNEKAWEIISNRI